MKRAQRRANLKKLLAQNDTDEKNVINEQNGRRQLRSAKSSALAGITNYLTKDQSTTPTEEVDVKLCANKKDKRKVDADDDETNPTHKKRLNLTRFIFKNKDDIPANILKAENDSDDFETPIKKIKRAPKLSQTTVTSKSSSTTNNVRKTKRQQKITTAFLRNEQMFSEVAAQHSMAENFNPDEVQLALALSRSEVETTNTIETAAVASKESTVPIEQNIRSKLQKFGFRTATKEDYTNCFAAAFLGNQRRTKSKWANKFTALTLHDPKVQLKKLHGNIEALLKRQYRTRSANTSEYKFKPYRVKSQLLSQYAVVDETAQIIRNLETHSTEQNLERYFITELFPVTQLPAGHLLKNWMIIPGRDLSPERKSTRCSAQSRKFQKFYKELEAFFSKNLEDLAKENDEIISTLKENQCKNSTANSELDGLIELISNTQKESELENAMQSDNQQYLSSVQSVVENVELRVGESQQICQNSSDLKKSSSSVQSVVENVELKVGASNEFYGNSSDLKKSSSSVQTIVENVELKISAGSEVRRNSSDLKKCSSSVQSVVENVELNVSASSEVRRNSSDLKKCSSSAQTIVENVELKVITSSESGTSSQTQTRSTSPDLFADSDSDVAEIEVEENISNNITTYEVYSSEEVKTSTEAGCKTDMLSVKADLIVDLTQDDIDSLHGDDNDNLKTPTPKKHEISKRLDFLETSNESKLSFLHTSPILFEDNEVIQKETACNILDKKSLNETNDCLLNNSVLEYIKSCSFGNSTVKAQEQEVDIHNKSLSTNNSTSSIDLTQDDEESTDACNSKSNNNDNDNDNYDENDDVCILLSDDEVNYSIMKADAAYFKSNNSFHEEYIDQDQFERSLQIQISEEHNFSVLDLIDVEHSFQVNEAFDKDFTKNASFNLSGDVEPICKEFLTSQRQTLEYPITPTKKQQHSISDMLKQQRAEFGILESQSETFSQTSPHWMKTPVVENTTPKKTTVTPSSTESHSYELQQQQFSRRSCAKKFESFLFEAPKTPKRAVSKSAAPNFDDFDDFDEFDRLVYGSPTKRVHDCNVPTGFSQLLTAELSVHANCFTTPTKSPSSALLAAALTPEKVATNITEEITINNRIYTVRVTNSPKPDFAAQTDSELLKQLYNFGIKPLKRNQALKLLEYIYNETHPIMEPDMSDELEAEIESNRDSFLTQEIEGSVDILINGKAIEANIDRDEVIQSQSNTKKLNLQDCNGELLLRFSTELFAELRNNEEFYIFQTNITKKTQQPLLPLHIAWYNLVCSNTALHECVLMYEPIDLQEIYLFLKSLGYRYDPKDLKRFFDSRCIIFRYDLTAPDKQGNRHVRKPSKKKIGNTQKEQKDAKSQRTLHQYFNL